MTAMMEGWIDGWMERRRGIRSAVDRHLVLCGIIAECTSTAIHAHCTHSRFGTRVYFFFGQPSTNCCSSSAELVCKFRRTICKQYLQLNAIFMQWQGSLVVVVVSYLVKVHSELLLSWAVKKRKKMENTTTIDQLCS